MRFASLSRVFPALLADATLAVAVPAVARDDDHRRHHDRDHREYRHDRDGRRDHDRRWERHDDRRDRRHSRWDDRDYRHGYRDGRRHERWDDRYDRYDRRHDRGIYYPPRVVYARPGYRPPPRWARGYRIHDYGWAPTYVVVDYHRYGRPHPPRGHHWRRDDRGNWLLVAIATGIVVDAILDH